MRDKAANADNSLVRVRTCCVQAIATKCIHLSEPALANSSKAFLASGSAAHEWLFWQQVPRTVTTERKSRNRTLARHTAADLYISTICRRPAGRLPVLFAAPRVELAKGIPKSALRLCEQRLREVDKSRGSQSGMWDGFETIAVFGTALGLRRFL